MNNKPIGIFDSGKGGLTVLDQVKRQLPQESVIYYGDVARIPFGDKKPQEIIKINKEIISYLINRDVKMVIIACNTSSAIALEVDHYEFSIPIVGLIEPGASGALHATKNMRIGVAATQGTVNSHAYYEKLMQEWNLWKGNWQADTDSAELFVYEVACPSFVPLVEAGIYEGEEVQAAIHAQMEKLKELNVDTIIHGCTHYPFLEKEMKKYFPEARFVDPAVFAVEEVKEILIKKNLLSDSNTPTYEYIISQMKGDEYVRIDGREYLFGSTSSNRK